MCNPALKNEKILSLLVVVGHACVAARFLYKATCLVKFYALFVDGGFLVC